jgi:hypothetical protein
MRSDNIPKNQIRVNVIHGLDEGTTTRNINLHKQIYGHAENRIYFALLSLTLHALILFIIYMQGYYIYTSSLMQQKQKKA